jgi:ATP-dependent DNA ligase
LYDIVYLNGTVLTNLPLRARLERLKEAVPIEMKGRVQVKEFLFFAIKKITSIPPSVT